MTRNGLLHNRIALVTGGANGLGRAIATRFQREGGRGTIFDIGASAGGPPDGWNHVIGDVTREDEIAAAFEQTYTAFGRLDIVVANAGIVPPWSETDQIDLDMWDKAFAVNVRGVAATVKHAVPFMKQAGGSIILMASLNAWHAHPRQCLYTATKHAVLGIARATALDLGRYNIRVNAIGPGPVATEALCGRVDNRAAAGGPAPDAAFAELAAQSALGRIATEDDIAANALYLASDLSAGQTGTLQKVDCGMG